MYTATGETNPIKKMKSRTEILAWSSEQSSELTEALYYFSLKKVSLCAFAHIQ
jgi:hypothetical protein